MRKLGRILLQCSILGLMCMLLSGCFLRLLFGSVAQRDTDFGIVFIAHLGGTIGPMAICDIDRENGNLTECDYSFFDIEAEEPFVTTSTTELINEFGVFGLLVDPLILQVPTAVKNVAGTINDGSGPRAVVISEASSFMAQPGSEVRAEAGQKFLMLDLPPDLIATLTQSGQLAGPFDFQLEFEVPTLAAVPVKAMFTGKVVSNGQTYYPPLLPCVTDFAAVPEIRIPVFERPALMLPQVVSAARRNPDLACRGQVYDFRPAGGVPRGRIYLPLLET